MRELDDATRPRAARGVPLTARQQLGGQHLQMIHDHFRSELAGLLAGIDDVRRGAADVSVVRDAVQQVTRTRREQETTGFCAQVCHFVTTHHTIEDQMLFPPISALPGYAPVVERLADEHLIVHDHLVAIDAVLVRLATGETDLDELAAAVEAMTAVLLSHFRYEEDELGEALGLSGLLV